MNLTDGAVLVLLATILVAFERVGLGGQQVVSGFACFVGA